MTQDHTLAEIVDRQPGAAPVLERHHLDYCCGGGRTLADACAAAGIDPTPVLDELAHLADAATSEPGAWTAMTPTQLVDHIEAAHHQYLHEQLPRLSALAQKVVGVHGARHVELARVQRSFEALRDDLEPHLAKEERILFPRIRQLDAAADAPETEGRSLSSPIQVMLSDHDRAGELLEELRATTDGYRPPGDACASYRALYEGLEELEADTHLHVHKENNVLFPAVLAIGSATGTGLSRRPR